MSGILHMPCFPRYVSWQRKRLKLLQIYPPPHPTSPLHRRLEVRATPQWAGFQRGSRSLAPPPLRLPQTVPSQQSLLQWVWQEASDLTLAPLRPRAPGLNVFSVVKKVVMWDDWTGPVKPTWSLCGIVFFFGFPAVYLNQRVREATVVVKWGKTPFRHLAYLLSECLPLNQNKYVDNKILNHQVKCGLFNTPFWNDGQLSGRVLWLAVSLLPKRTAFFPPLFLSEAA